MHHLHASHQAWIINLSEWEIGKGSVPIKHQLHRPRKKLFLHHSHERKQKYCISTTLCSIENNQFSLWLWQFHRPSNVKYSIFVSFCLVLLALMWNLDGENSIHVYPLTEPVPVQVDGHKGWWDSKIIHKWENLQPEQ